ncbi:hypothetical protein PT137_04705 (plasmid) [Borreliella garinii]|nr:hypothetical protein PT142_04755 [Borreliella garinii]WNZ75041.1 hypothetical protein PT137_04705 [Borreliella garinii]
MSNVVKVTQGSRSLANYHFFVYEIVKCRFINN